MGLAPEGLPRGAGALGGESHAAGRSSTPTPTPTPTPTLTLKPKPNPNPKPNSSRSHSRSSSASACRPCCPRLSTRTSSASPPCRCTSTPPHRRSAACPTWRPTCTLKRVDVGGRPRQQQRPTSLPVTATGQGASPPPGQRPPPLPSHKPALRAAPRLRICALTRAQVHQEHDREQPRLAHRLPRGAAVYRGPGRRHAAAAVPALHAGG